MLCLSKSLRVKSCRVHVHACIQRCILYVCIFKEVFDDHFQFVRGAIVGIHVPELGHIAECDNCMHNAHVHLYM